MYACIPNEKRAATWAAALPLSRFGSTTTTVATTTTGHLIAEQQLALVAIHLISTVDGTSLLVQICWSELTRHTGALPPGCELSRLCWRNLAASCTYATAFSFLIAQRTACGPSCSLALAALGCGTLLAVFPPTLLHEGPIRTAITGSYALVLRLTLLTVSLRHGTLPCKSEQQSNRRSPDFQFAASLHCSHRPIRSSPRRHCEPNRLLLQDILCTFSKGSCSSTHYEPYCPSCSVCSRLWAQMMVLVSITGSSIPIRALPYLSQESVLGTAPGRLLSTTTMFVQYTGNMHPRRNRLLFKRVAYNVTLG